MKITAIELYHVSDPLEETFWPTWIPGYPQTHNRFTLIKIKSHPRKGTQSRIGNQKKKGKPGRLTLLS